MINLFKKLQQDCLGCLLLSKFLSLPKPLSQGGEKIGLLEEHIHMSGKEPDLGITISWLVLMVQFISLGKLPVELIQQLCMAPIFLGFEPPLKWSSQLLGRSRLLSLLWSNPN